MENRNEGRFNSLLNLSASALAVLMAGALILAGCASEKEYVDRTGPTTGEVEIEDDETEFEAERELPEDHNLEEKEIEYEDENTEYEAEVDKDVIGDDEIEIEGEQEYEDGENPAWGNKGDTNQAGGESATETEDDTKVYSMTTIYAAPVDYVGATVEGKAEVTKVISDRGFWVEKDGNKFFAVVREDAPKHEMIDINKGQTVKFEGLLLEANQWQNLTGSLEKETRQTIRQRDYFIAVYHDDMTVMNKNSGSQSSM